MKVLAYFETLIWVTVGDVGYILGSGGNILDGGVWRGYILGGGGWRYAYFA